MVKYLNFKDLCERGLFNNRTTLKRYIDHHGFPRPYRMAASRALWREDEVEAWLESRRERAETAA